MEQKPKSYQTKISSFFHPKNQDKCNSENTNKVCNLLKKTRLLIS